MREKLPLSTPMLANARNLRSSQTDAEQRMWYFLRGRRLLGLKFRRQVAMPPYILDFFCVEYRLAIELDGSQHRESSLDARRDAWLAARRIKVLRFWNHDVLLNAEAVLESIRLEIQRLSLTPSPSPEGRGESNSEE